MTARKAKGRRLSVKEWVMIGGLAVLLVWLIYLNVSIFRKEEIARDAARSTQAQLTSLQTREKTLEDNITDLSTERGQEATLRDTFGVARPGEGVIVVVPTKVASTTPPETFWQKWFGWLRF